MLLSAVLLRCPFVIAQFRFRFTRVRFRQYNPGSFALPTVQSLPHYLISSIFLFDSLQNCRSFLVPVPMACVPVPMRAGSEVFKLVRFPAVGHSERYPKLFSLPLYHHCSLWVASGGSWTTCPFLYVFLLSIPSLLFKYFVLGHFSYCHKEKKQKHSII